MDNKNKIKVLQDKVNKLNPEIVKLTIIADRLSKIQDLKRELESKIRDIFVSPPDKGSFIAYKAAYKFDKTYPRGTKVIVKLKVSPRAKRYKSLGEKKIRVSSAKVVSIYSISSNKRCQIARSSYDCKFFYKVGKTVKPKKAFSKHGVCASGIHCFIRREDAVHYSRNL